MRGPALGLGRSRASRLASPAPHTTTDAAAPCCAQMAMQWNPVDNASPQLTRNPGAQYPAPTPSHVLSPMQVQQLQQRYGGGGGAPPGSAGPPQTPGELILAQKQHEEQRRQGPSQMMPPVREQPQTWREAAAPAPPAYEPSRMHYGELPPQPAPAAAAPSGFSGGHGHDWSQGRDYGMDAATYIEHGGRLTPPAPPPQMAPPQALLSPQVAAARADYRAQYGQQQEQQYGNPGSAQAPQGQTIRGPGVLWPEEYGDRGQPGHAPPEVLAHAQRAVLAHDTASAQARAAMGAVQASPSQPSHGGYHQPAPLGAYPHQQQGAYGSPVMEPPQATWRHMQMQEAGGLSRHDSKPVHGRSPLAGFAQRNVSQGGFA